MVRNSKAATFCFYRTQVQQEGCPSNTSFIAGLIVQKVDYFRNIVRGDSVCHRLVRVLAMNMVWKM